MELKAFEKSTRRMKRFSGGMLGSSRPLATACTMASHPAGMPTPSWRGARNSRALRRTDLAAHFEVRRRRTSPTAIGLLLTGQKRSATEVRDDTPWYIAGTEQINQLSEENKGTVSPIRRWAKHSLLEMISRRPEGPGTEPLQNG